MKATGLRQWSNRSNAMRLRRREHIQGLNDDATALREPALIWISTHVGLHSLCQGRLRSRTTNCTRAQFVGRKRHAKRFGGRDDDFGTNKVRSANAHTAI